MIIGKKGLSCGILLFFLSIVSSPVFGLDETGIRNVLKSIDQVAAAWGTERVESILRENDFIIHDPPLQLEEAEIFAEKDIGLGGISAMAHYLRLYKDNHKSFSLLLGFDDPRTEREAYSAFSDIVFDSFGSPDLYVDYGIKRSMEGYDCAPAEAALFKYSKAEIEYRMENFYYKETGIIPFYIGFALSPKGITTLQQPLVFIEADFTDYTQPGERASERIEDGLSKKYIIDLNYSRILNINYTAIASIDKVTDEKITTKVEKNKSWFHIDRINGVINLETFDDRQSLGTIHGKYRVLEEVEFFKVKRMF